MDPTLQIDPDRCVLVLGSQLAAAALALSEGIPAALSYAMVIDIGVQKMLQVEGIEDKVEERSRRQTLLLSAYELEPSFAASKVVDCFREHGVYQQWLNELFGSLLALPVHKNPGGVVDTLKSLQEKGVLLVYTYYDTILDAAMNTSPILLQDEDSVRSWASHQTSGLLHVHGVYSKPDSVCCDCVNYRRLVGETSGGKLLKEVCRNRHIIFAGFDREFFDPFLTKFAQNFLSSSHPPPLLLSTTLRLPYPYPFLNLRVPQLANLEKLFLCSSPAPRLGTRDSVENKISTTLIYINKNSCQDAAERVKVTSGINVHQLTMRHEHPYHHLLLYLDREGLKELWKILFLVSPQDVTTPTGLHSGLLGFMLDNTVVWLKRAAALGKTISPLPSPMETSQGLHEHPPPSTALHPPRTGHTPSLTTNVSVISSVWAPIASTSISKSPSGATRPTLPSPLISSTSRTALGGVATRGLREQQMSLLDPHHLHRQVRRVQSEKDHLTYSDRLAKQALRKNGMLLHTESAPDFVESTTRGLVAHPTDSLRVGGVTRSSSFNLPSGNQMEVKIEYVDQLCQTGSGGGPLAAAEQKRPVPAISPSGFVEERQKFISEAQSWSKLVDSELAKKKKVVSSGAPVTAAAAGALGLGLFTSRLTGQTSLSSKFSQEEQEKILRQHFEQIQQQQQLMSVPSSSSSLAPSPTFKPPHGSISTAHPSHTHSAGHTHQPHPSPKHSGGAPSPKKSPINPFQTSATPPTMFPFMTQATTGFQNSAANFICNPASLSQYQAAMLNPLYQAAALQQLMTSQVKGKQPLLVSDPSILQSLVDRLPIFMPDGSITFLPTTVAAALPQGGRENGVGKEEGPMRSPGPDGGSNHKRTRSPEGEGRNELRGSPPKRRRSSSLPDITQIPQVTTLNRKEGIKEEEDGEVGVARSRLISVMPTTGESPRQHRQLAPPTMIHIPQDMKLNDPMMGFPTPPQSSPLVGNFALSGTLSPIVFSSANFHAHQPMTPVTPNQDSLVTEEFRELVVDAGGVQTAIPPSPEGSNLPPFPAGRGPIQLWQFLLDLLLSPDKKHLIDWTGTGNGYEFRILQPEEIAKLWGARKNKPRMNYDKLSRGLRYYYSKGIMDKVQGKKLTFKYTCDVQNYVNSRHSQNSTPHGKYRSGSESSTPVAGGRGDEMQGEDPMEDSDRERSYSDLDLMSGFHAASAVKKDGEAGLTGVMGVVSQGFVQQPGDGRRENSSTSDTSLCSEAA